MNKKIKNLLLWFLVFPLSVLGTLTFFCVYNLILYKYINNSFWLDIFCFEILSNFFSGFIFILIGYKIAPNNKKNTTIVLTILFLLIGFSSFFIVNFITKEYISNIGILSSIFGSITCCIFICIKLIKIPKLK